MDGKPTFAAVIGKSASFVQNTGFRTPYLIANLSDQTILETIAATWFGHSHSWVAYTARFQDSGTERKMAMIGAGQRLPKVLHQPEVARMLLDGGE
jgi:hypothetical protein